MKHKDKQDLRLAKRQLNAGSVNPKEGTKMPGSMNRHKSTSIKVFRKERAK